MCQQHASTLPLCVRGALAASLTRTSGEEIALRRPRLRARQAKEEAVTRKRRTLRAQRYKPSAPLKENSLDLTTGCVCLVPRPSQHARTGLTFNILQYINSTTTVSKRARTALALLYKIFSHTYTCYKHGPGRNITHDQLKLQSVATQSCHDKNTHTPNDAEWKKARSTHCGIHPAQTQVPRC